jgi:hypothetical protein
MVQMRYFKIYECGGMSGLSNEEQNSWRVKCKDWLLKQECNYHINVINPCDYFTIGMKKHSSEKEIMNYDLNHVRTSNLLITYFNAPNSIGSAIEMFLAKELHIPVIGISTGQYIHPWILECVDRMFDNIDDALEYIKEFYLLA